MNFRNTTLILAALFLPVSFLSISSAQEQIKIGTITMNRVMNDYHRTIAFSNTIQQEAREAEIEVEVIRGNLGKLLDKRSELEAQINSPELTPEKKQSLRMEYQGLTAEIAVLDRELQETVRLKQAQFVERRRQFMRESFNKLSVTIEEVSRREGYDLVLERSGVTQSGFPVVLYAGNAADFTDLVIAEINKDAPEGFNLEDRENAQNPAGNPAE